MSEQQKFWVDYNGSLKYGEGEIIRVLEPGMYELQTTERMFGGVEVILTRQKVQHDRGVTIAGRSRSTSMVGRRTRR